MTAETKSNIVAIDPGSDKLGIAVLAPDGAVLTKKQVSRKEFPDTISDFLGRFDPCFVAVGDGTNSEWVLDWLKITVKIPIVTVQERGSTLEARELGWKEIPPVGIIRFLPKIFRPDPDDMDAWAAVVIGRRALAERNSP